MKNIILLAVLTTLTLACTPVDRKVSFTYEEDVVEEKANKSWVDQEVEERTVLKTNHRQYPRRNETGGSCDSSNKVV